MDIAETTTAFQALKITLVGATGLSKDALHIYIGLALFLAVRLAWRQRGGWMLAWLAALAIALGGEWFDLRGQGLNDALRPDSAHWHDLWNTMFWPTLLALVGRWLHPAPPPIADPLSADERA